MFGAIVGDVIGSVHEGRGTKTNDLILTYFTNTASSQYQIIQFEYAFGENISLLGVRDPNGMVGVELRFRRRFK